MYRFMRNKEVSDEIGVPMIALLTLLFTLSQNIAAAPSVMHQNELNGNRVTSALYNMLHYGNSSGISQKENAMATAAVFSGFATGLKNSETCASRSTSFDRQLCSISFITQGSPY